MSRALEVSRLRVDLGGRTILEDVSLRVAEGEPSTLCSPEPWMETFHVSKDSALLRSLGMVRR